ncbi:MAG: RNA methyltransferase [Gemmatimonadetes bacterium]|nr:RNA methyltransferase [Gemmatimonadota bacterium]NNL31407.1 RNA methyltransferase [Gemmatimonadota bacterium]
MPLSQRRSKLLKRLHTNKLRAREGLVLVEGIRSVSEALEAGASTSFAVVSPRLESTDSGRALLSRLNGDVVDVSDAEMVELADTEHPQGVLLVVQEPHVELADAVRTERRILVLDALQDPGNVGTLVRSAVAFSFETVVALDGTTDPWGSKAVRATAGTIFHLDVVRATAGELLQACRAAGLPILAASAEGSAGVEAPTGGLALIIGNEGAGVRPDVRAAADAMVAVVMAGPVESLNAGIAGSILMSEFTRTKNRGEG